MLFIQTRFIAGLTLLTVSIAAFIACTKSSDTVTTPVQITVSPNEQKLDAGTAATFGKVIYSLLRITIQSKRAPEVFLQSTSSFTPATRLLFTHSSSLKLEFLDAFSGMWLPCVFSKDRQSHIFVKMESECNRNVANTIRQYTNQIVALSQYTLQSDPHTIGSQSISIIFIPNLK